MAKKQTVGEPEQVAPKKECGRFQIPRIKDNAHFKVNMYFPPESKDLIVRTRKLARSTKVGFGQIMVACLEACLEQLEKEMPDKRRFTLNGREVVIL